MTLKYKCLFDVFKKNLQLLPRDIFKFISEKMIRKSLNSYIFITPRISQNDFVCLKRDFQVVANFPSSKNILLLAF